MFSKIMSIFNGVKSFFSSFISQILGGLCIALALLCLFFYMSSNSKELSIKDLERQVTEITTEKNILESQLANCKIQFDAVIEAKEMQQGIIDKINQADQETLEQLSQLNSTIKGNKNETLDNSSILPSDTQRLLDDYCRKAKGSACTNP